VKVYTDGACRDGVGGWGWWCPATKEWRSGDEAPSTNQRMELMAALEAVNHFYDTKNLVIISDSSYLVNCFGERWWIKWVQNGWISSRNKEVLNRDIWEPLLEMVEKHGNIKFIWVKGHSGDAGNEKADELATGAVIKKQKELGKTPELAKAIIETPLKVGERHCSYCKEEATTHFFLLFNKKFLAGCDKHAAQLRMPLLLTEPFDEHPWTEACNTEHSSWVNPIEPEFNSWCLEAH
jgi:ribonuclease HI